MKQKNKWNQIYYICEACVLYSQASLTLEQIHNKVRGNKRAELMLSYPDQQLGWLLYELSCDFYAWYGVRNDIISDKIHQIATYLGKKSNEIKAKNLLANSVTPVLH